MNIFVLSEGPVEAARMQCDKHVVKMIVETAQMLCTVGHGPYNRLTQIIRALYGRDEV